MAEVTALHFGTLGRVGHGFHLPKSNHVPYYEAMSLLPWDRIDNYLNPKEQVEGWALLHHKDGWTALAFADRTDDSRPNSNSVFFFKGTFTFEETMDKVHEYFPHILSRFKFKIVLNEQP